MRTHWLVVAAVLVLYGCGDPITKLVNEKFPPINVDAQRQIAIDTELLSNLVYDELIQAAACSNSSDLCRTPSLNFTPTMTSASNSKPSSRRNDCSAHIASL